MATTTQKETSEQDAGNAKDKRRQPACQENNMADIFTL